jgi:UDP-N-acetylmuramate--alanine ligase
MVLNRVESKDKKLLNKQEMLNWMIEHVKSLDKEFGEVIVMAGAGDIDGLVKPVKEILES